MEHILDPIVHALQPLLMLFTTTFHSYGLAIIVFTILVRGVLAPLNLRQLKSAKKMAALQPRVKELQQRYKGNREELTKAQMALYKEVGVNPAAGCLPLLLQMPILYSLFFIFENLAHPNTAAIYHAHFLWFVLDKPDSLFGHFFFGPHSFWGPLPIMAAVFQWVQQRMMMQPTSDPQQRSTQQIMQFMPLFIMLFAVNYPAGLALYWVTSTLFSIVMQYFITGWGQLFKSPFKMPEVAPSTGGSSGSGGASGPRRPSPAGPRPGSNGNGGILRAMGLTARPPTPEVEDAPTGEAGAKADARNAGQGAWVKNSERQGKMQRTVSRQQKSRSSKGARR